jgi:hypothetical protein
MGHPCLFWPMQQQQRSAAIPAQDASERLVSLSKLIKDSCTGSDECLMSREKHQLWLEAPAVIDMIPSAASNIEVSIRIAGTASEVETLKAGCNCGTRGRMQEAHSCTDVGRHFTGPAQLVLPANIEADRLRTKLSADSEHVDAIAPQWNV